MKGANRRETTGSGWIIVAGAGLAIVAAGSLIAFSLMARRAGDLRLPNAAATPNAHSASLPPVTLGRSGERPNENEGRPRTRRDRDGKTAAPNAPIVLGTRIDRSSGDGADAVVATHDRGVEPNPPHVPPHPGGNDETLGRFSCDPPGRGIGRALGHCKHDHSSARTNAAEPPTSPTGHAGGLAPAHADDISAGRRTVHPAIYKKEPPGHACKGYGHSSAHAKKGR